MRILVTPATLALLLVSTSSWSTHGFAPVARTRQWETTRRADFELYSAPTKGTEKLLRDEIAEKTSVVQDEEKYAVTEADGMEELLLDTEITTKTTPADKNSLQARMDRMTQPRAYPLFLMEKGFEFLDSTVGGIVKSIPFLDGASSSVAEPKERVVVLGTGWGAASFLKEIDTNRFDVTVISPRNYFLFTPMLAGASVGTVEFQSITEPVREINRKTEYLEATATNINIKDNIVSCETVICDGNSCEIEDFDVQFDRLVVTVGAQTNTFGIPGVRENCCFLKQVEDARRIRTAIVNCFERANLPQLTDEERENNLTFGIIGAGPTGIEFAAELRDFIEQDGPKYYPDLLKFVRIKVIEASSNILAPFDKELQEEAVEQLNRKMLVSNPEIANLLPERFELTELLLDSAVKEVTEKTIVLASGREIHYGVAVWAAGNGPLPITLQLIEELGEEQAKEQGVARGRVAVDPWLRAVGGDGKILSFGDCSCESKGQLPATAQVASQQGEYLAGIMSKNYNLSPPVSEEGIFPPPTKDPEHKQNIADAIAGFATQNPDFAKPFQFLNLGILAYTGGGSALAQVAVAPDAPAVKGKGKIGNAVWRSVYLTKQVSWRNRLLVLNDWAKRQIFGRDITRL